MTITTRTMEWLNQNRERAYPFVRDKWRTLDVVKTTPALDCVVLDAAVFDADAAGDEALVLKSVSVTKDGTTVVFKYGDIDISPIKLPVGTTSGEGSFVCLNGLVEKSSALVSISISCSSHAYVLEALGEGSWDIGCEVVPTRVMRLSGGTGVCSLSTNGSSKVEGCESASDICYYKYAPNNTDEGVAVLEDGYRTSPVVKNGKVLVRVGTKYGYNPCKYDFGDAGSTNCSEPLFFFCGQNAINSGNIVISGGRGVSVIQGGTYTIDNSRGDAESQSSCNGKTIPCIEIIAGQELLELSRKSV